VSSTVTRKTGIECLSEIKNNHRLKDIPIIILSTSLNPEVVEKLYKKGAWHYIRKPAKFNHLKSVINKAITSSLKNRILQPGIENFLLQPESEME